jgi:hypothetical protein
LPEVRGLLISSGECDSGPYREDKVPFHNVTPFTLSCAPYNLTPCLPFGSLRIKFYKTEVNNKMDDRKFKATVQQNMEVSAVNV